MRSAVHAKFAVARCILIQREQQAVSRRGDTDVPGHGQQRGEAIESGKDKRWHRRC
ncbi:hypothetical protein PK69_19940 [Xanthomonas phaseoli pv. phaseoli]|uniref:Uncharacterized protein n=1 Tax=Xanthomonas campestris pv. phaseoli TaxID=317013 RepID=A0AB34QKK9_XANCH|nr:hypothetical protein AC609_01035 [Xanthomonas phaseoli pv. phaseoli]AZU32495.1 hypothetical protein AC801_22915 [Xanthomonas sp. ISO98C4]AZU24100.1 hypothetical protein AC611_01035 [Xanthomonas phaseoli pv. phaseoli]AZU32868.1 hypothetical protein AC610_01035 [Xanthomonas phaseoli pv. phaseoli]KGT50951.1 hypothetical protein NZ02_11620 [Xanthomonas phaseoli pv. phaseoli]